MQHSSIRKGVSTSGLALALGLFAAAGGVVFVRSTTNWTLAIRNFALPSWSLYVVAGVLAAAGLFAFLMSLSVEKCATCGGQLDAREAYFPLDLEPQVVHAVQNLDAASLAAFPMVPKNQMKMELRISTCPRHHVGTIELCKWQDYQPHDVLPEAVIQGPLVAAMADLADRHENFRGDDD